MNILAVLAVVVLGASAIDQEFMKQTRARVRKIAEECVTEEKAKMSDLEMIISMKIPETHEGKCVLFCIHKKFNIQNEDGTINNDGVKDTFDVIKDADAEYHAKMLNAFNHCLSTPRNSDPCVYSSMLSVCFLKKAKEEGIHEMLLE